MLGGFDFLYGGRIRLAYKVVTTNAKARNVVSLVFIF
jgi:hypothetical protein